MTQRPCQSNEKMLRFHVKSIRDKYLCMTNRHFAILGSLMGLICLLLTTAGCSSLFISTDYDLISTVRSHRISFEKILAMMCEDQGGTVVMYDNLPPGISQERKQQYRDLLLEMRPCVSAALVFGNGWARFCANGGKGVEYIPEGRSRSLQLQDTLDRVDDLPPGVYYREIDPDWYVFYQKNDD